MSNGESNGDFEPLQPARLDWQADTPVATDFDDPYFSRQDGMAESDYVFLQGNRLRERFRTLRPGQHFVIGETGFGTGLNMLLAARLFLRLAPEDTLLDLLSVEKHPLHAEDLARALAHWPDLADLAAPLQRQYPPPCPGYHRLQLHPRVRLTLMYGEATAQWRHCHSTVDAWFLDGFAPSRNPHMWQPELFRQLARLSRPGATFATFTAAGEVRRGLQEAGFQVRRIDGFGHKRHMAVGEFGDDNWTARHWQRGHAVVAGAGLAGASSARALAERGWRVPVLDPAGIAQGASGNLAGVVYSTPSAHLTPQNRFYQMSYVHALRWLNRFEFPNPEQGRLNGVVQYPVDQRQQDKLNGALQSGVWPDTLLRPREDGGMLLAGGGYLRPGAWCETLLDHPAIEVRRDKVTGYVAGDPVRVSVQGGGELEGDTLILATAAQARRFDDLHWLPLKIIRGQVSYCRATEASAKWQQARCHGGYLTPAVDGLHCVGATFDLHDDNPRPSDHHDQVNLLQLKQYLPEAWRELGGEHIEVVDRRVAFRCQSNDFLPLCGPQPRVLGPILDEAPGVWLNLAHGSRGITGTPLCADLLADRLSGLPLPVDDTLAEALAPVRFLHRQRRKKRPRRA
ncbi:bifunctional tRNA (5-methylaminomethyl-2-thiouridine)(34)-methyltransferase MnmD/FAD-dependent 5-carboxymethylaminomethyl-2-thiouridine(34) oxidoreductase MnmC [Alloalcanivorax xenomutans]|uniref:bifunctional tRNA (5-methylaminomethyl-2-thiouridine)(34)-methyltransferase MnmD/FAD-dependent 5-carboxymethylaminomethyl-2-thiouridine(34) oxidoreductase MnmC n=1 Tax=Alloalcanivorax xenomutans TaxID=1094342 RepID=UPI003A80C194